MMACSVLPHAAKACLRTPLSPLLELEAAPSFCLGQIPHKTLTYNIPRGHLTEFTASSHSSLVPNKNPVRLHHNHVRHRNQDPSPAPPCLGSLTGSSWSPSAPWCSALSWGRGVDVPYFFLQPLKLQTEPSTQAGLPTCVSFTSEFRAKEAEAVKVTQQVPQVFTQGKPRNH